MCVYRQLNIEPDKDTVIAPSNLDKDVLSYITLKPHARPPQKINLYSILERIVHDTNLELMELILSKSTKGYLGTYSIALCLCVNADWTVQARALWEPQERWS